MQSSKKQGTILVTGGLGNLGLSTLDALTKQGIRARVLDLPTRANRMRARRLPPSVELCFGDITKDDDVARALEGVQGVVHLAALIPPTSERLGEVARRVNVDGTARLVERARVEGIAGPFVFSSSCTVYGRDAADGRLAKIDDPLVGTDNYTRGKIEAEAIVREGASLPTIMRLGVSIEGTRSATDTIVLRQLFEVAPDNPIELVHGEDVANAIANAIARPEAHGKIWNVGGGPTCRVRQRDLVRAMERTLRIAPFPDEAFGAGRAYTCYMDTEASERVLGFQRHDYDAIVRDLGARIRLLTPLLALAAPITRRVMLSYSGPYEGKPMGAAWGDLIANDGAS